MIIHGNNSKIFEEKYKKVNCIITVVKITFYLTIIIWFILKEIKVSGGVQALDIRYIESIRCLNNMVSSAILLISILALKKLFKRGGSKLSSDAFMVKKRLNMVRVHNVLSITLFFLSLATFVSIAPAESIDDIKHEKN